MRKVLFLTSTVNPSIIKFVGTNEQRRQEYINAIQFYLENTNLRILIVDNSGYDFSQDFDVETRLECLAYKAESQNCQGKGYGELSLMKFGFEKSNFLKDADQIIKVTGRHIIKNINRLINTCTQVSSVYADVDVHLTFAMTYFFIAPKKFYYDYLFPAMDKLNDDKKFYLEHLVAEALMKWLQSDHTFHEFKYPIYLVGHQGASLQPYKAPSIMRYLKIRIKYIIRECMNDKNKYKFLK